MGNLLSLLPSAFKDEPDRGYRLRHDEYVPDGIRRIARGQLELARDDLAGAPARKQAEVVHETRKRLKRLRACVRLARDAVGDETYERENDAFRAAAHELSAGRDAQVLLDTLDDLRERFAEELAPRATERLRDQLEAARDRAVPSGDDERVDAVLATLRNAHARTAAWTFEDDGFDALAPGLRRIYRRGRKRMRAARKDPSPVNLHAWRKRVKDLWHATQIIQPAKPKRMKRLAKRTHTLADLLGDGHDLSLLRDHVQAHPEQFDVAAHREALVALIERREIALRDDALDLGRKLYDQSPKRFITCVARGWRKRAPVNPRPLAR
jgi:CHAD domain-containing protein